MLGILTPLLGLVDPITRIAGKIADARIAAVQASTDKARIEAETEVKALEARRDVLVAEAPGSRLNQAFRIVISIPAAVILYKIEIWDRVLDWGSTPKLSVEEWTYIWMVCGFYLLGRTIQVARR